MSEYLDFSLKLAKEASEIIKANFALGTSSNQKLDHTPVTVVDQKVNQLVIDRLREKFPDHSVQGEEQNHTVTGSEYKWVCDPIDGTIAFANGIPTSVFSLGLMKNNQPVCGVIVDPFTDRVYSAEAGKGAFLNGSPIQVKDNFLEGGVVGMTPWKDAQFDAIPLIQALQDRNAFVINLTSYANPAMLVAAGQLTAAIYIDNKLHDIYPAGLIVEEAGGIAMDLRGNKQDYTQPIIGQIVTNKKLLPEIVDLLKI